MVNPDILFGRLSNRMFEMAAYYAWTKDNDIPFFAQDEKYFKKYEQEIRHLYGAFITDRGIDKVAIHVRRAKNPIDPREPAYAENGFYVNLGHHLHEDMSDNYYVRAMKLFPGEDFLVFSDDIEWCKNSPIFQGCAFREGGSEIEDMNSMASCKHQIIANSSFSWWAAWLNPNPEKKVVAPKKWFADPANDHLIGIPDSWIRI